MKAVFTILFLIFFVKIGFTTITIANTQKDSTPLIRIVTKDAKVVLGRLMYFSEDSVYILPGTRKDEQKGRFYQPIGFCYKDISAIRYRDDFWIGLILGMPGVIAVVLMAAKGTVFSNDLGKLNEAIWLSVLFFGVGLWRMFSRKRWLIDGKKRRFEKFKEQFGKKNKERKPRLIIVSLLLAKNFQ